MSAQIEHVPVGHPVYDFFDRMSVKGFLPDYSRASQPIARKQAVQFIDSLQQFKNEFTQSEVSLLLRFEDEFVKEQLGTQEHVDLFRGDQSFAEKIQNVFTDKEKFLYSWRDSSTTFFMEFLASGDYRTAIAKENKSNVFLGQVGGRFRGTVKSFLGYALQATNGTDLGSKGFALTDRVLRQNANFADFGNSFFDFTEAYLSADFGWGNIVLGKERFLIGSGIGTQLIVSANAPTFDAVRFETHLGNFRYLFAHSSVLGQKQILSNGRVYYDPKFLAVHRAEVKLFDAVRFGVFESIIYANRYLDLAYINPINFFKSAEHALGDRDNSLLGFDLQSFSIPGIQLYGTWLIDDIDFSKMGSHWWGNKFAWQAGVNTTIFFPNTDIACELTRVEPYTYSHFISENNYTHKGYVIGAEIPPNADEWMFRIRHWIESKTIVTLTYQYNRHGQNEITEDGILTRNVGGDALIGFVNGRDKDIVSFLDGDRVTKNTITFNIRYEPFRNIVFDFVYRYRHQTPSQHQNAINDHFLSFLVDLSL